MRRRKVLLISICLAICAGLLPLGAVVYLSHRRALEGERLHLREYANWTLMRAGVTLNQARNALSRIEDEAKLRDCSEEHIRLMQQLSVDASSVKELGFAEPNGPRCTSSNVSDLPLADREPDHVFADGAGLYLGIRGLKGPEGAKIALNRGSYFAFVRSQRMIDVLADTRMTLGLATAGGKLIAVSGNVSPELVAQLTAKASVEGENEASIFASSSADGLVAFAIAERAVLKPRFDRELWFLVPLSIGASLLLVGAITWGTRRRLSQHGELMDAIKDGELIAHYQPIIDLSTGACIGGEALVRWRRPDGTIVPPNLFIPLAEQNGMVPAITDAMAGLIARDLADFLADNPELHVSINASASDIESGRLPSLLDRVILRSGIAAGQVWIEVTERELVHADAAREHVSALRAAGYVVAIDDFGTGYSSLSLLEQLPLDVLKIEKSFVDAIGKEAATSVVTPSIIKMAHALQLHIVAEGVETKEQEAYLRLAGVQYAQGWHYAKALPPAEFIEFCRSMKPGRAKPVVHAIA